MSTILEDYVYPDGYLKEQQEGNLRDAIGDELWEYLERLENKKSPAEDDGA